MQINETHIAIAARRQLATHGISLIQTHALELIAALRGYGTLRQSIHHEYTPEYQADFTAWSGPQFMVLNSSLVRTRLSELDATRGLPAASQIEIARTLATHLRASDPEHIFPDEHDFARDYVIPTYTPLIIASEAVTQAGIETGVPGAVLIETIDIDYPTLWNHKEPAWQMEYGGILAGAGVDTSEEANISQVMFRAFFEFTRIAPAIVSGPYVHVNAWSHFPQDYRSANRNEKVYSSVV
jgi:hypothetical protein